MNNIDGNKPLTLKILGQFLLQLLLIGFRRIVLLVLFLELGGYSMPLKLVFFKPLPRLLLLPLALWRIGFCFVNQNRYLLYRLSSQNHLILVSRIYSSMVFCSPSCLFLELESFKCAVYYPLQSP
jgi:hypothetical protein